MYEKNEIIYKPRLFDLPNLFLSLLILVQYSFCETNK